MQGGGNGASTGQQQQQQQQGAGPGFPGFAGGSSAGTSHYPGFHIILMQVREAIAEFVCNPGC